MLTDLGRANVFRVRNRDDAVGMAVGDYLADHWPDKDIAILHDDTAFGKDIAEEAKKQARIERGLTEAIYRAYVPGTDGLWRPKSRQLQAAEVAMVFIGGYHTEIGLMARLAGDRGYPIQLVAGTNMGTEDFALIAGPAAEGTIFTDHRRPARTRRSSARRGAVPSVGLRTRG